VIPPDIRAHVKARDYDPETGRSCLGPRIGMPNPCRGADQIDHILTYGKGVKCKPLPGLLASLCGLEHHPLKTNRASTWRPLLLGKVAELEARVASGYWPAT
jgi:hypothetical protein